MAFRRRDDSVSGYSSADAYRSVPITSPRLDEDAHLTSPIVSPQPLSEGRPRADSTVLSPPRPQFAAGGDSRSWVSSDNEASDSDSAPPPPPPHARSGSQASQGGAPGRVRSPPAGVRTRNHRRRSSMANEYAYAAAGEEELGSPTSSQGAGGALGNPFGTPRSSVYDAAAAGAKGAAAPPSAFAFQSHAGNPDPIARRASGESLRKRTSSPPAPNPLLTPGYVPPYSQGMTNATNNNPLSPQAGYGTQYAQYGNGGYGVVGGEEELGRPFAPFMGVGSEGGHGGSQDGRNSPGLSNNPLYRNSAAGAMAVGYDLPRSQSSAALSMRAPFLSPASRPTSSVWAPPSVPYAYPPGSASSSALHGQYGFGGGSAYGGSQYGHGAYSSYADITAQLRKAKPVMPSSRLPQKMTDEEKPWTQLKDGRERAGWWLTLLGMFAGVAGAAVLCYFSYVSVDVLRDSDLCQVFSEDWSNGLDLNKTWYPDSQLGGFGNGEFQITSTNSKNLYVQNNQLYIMPTLTSDDIGESEIFNGGTYEVSGCTTSNATACKATSSNKTGAVINPVMSSRISTQNSYSIKYGRVEVVAKIPQGDWLWPAIWMLPVNNTYGPWPLSGEIDILEARGNPPSYGAQGTDFVRAALNYGVLDSLQTNIYGWWQDKRTAFSEDFHTYALEWTDSWMRLYVDSRIDAMVDLKMQGKGGKSFFDRGNYPSVAHNGSNTEVVIENIWATGGPSAPFDQEFYLIIDLAAGGTSGWFPDNVGDKPWYDGSATAMREFAEAQSTWYATWPSDADDRAFRIDSVKMWKLGAC